MRAKRYLFASFCLEIRSEEVIAPSPQFDGFEGGERADLIVTVVKGKLPERPEKKLYSAEYREWFTDGENEYLYTSFYDGKKNGLYTYSCRVSGGDGITLYIDFDSLWEKMVFEALDISDIFMRRSIAVMHSSHIVCGGYSILFTADKQVGKSTQANLWNKYAGADIVNGDRAAIREINGKIYACGIPLRGSSEISLNICEPIKAVVCLGQAKENRIRRLSPKEAFLNILGKFSYNTQNVESLSKASEMAALMSENIPVFYLECLPDESAVRCLECELEKLK